MITTLGFKNFKCFDVLTRIPTTGINLFTGVNGRGKSTTLQGLLLMKQSLEHSRTTEQLFLNGSCVELGTFDDIGNSDISRSESIELEFEFSFQEGLVRLNYTLDENVEDDMVAQIQYVDVLGNIHNKEHTIEIFLKGTGPALYHNGKEHCLYWKDFLFEKVDDHEDPFNLIVENINFTRIHYISADRLGPQDYYVKQNLAEFPNVGRRGEYTANILSKKGIDVVDDILYLKSGATKTVLDQTQAWLTRIFDGGTVMVSPTDANIVILAINSEKSSKTYKPTNVGFGYSYALPIIVSGLIAKPGDILIVENPEAHLHPYAQSQITNFLAKVSRTGVQVFIESHSDHILNALRIAVLDRVIEKKEDLSVLYFHRDKKTKITKVHVESDGSIEKWPEGFFDQTNLDFSRLFGV